MRVKSIRLINIVKIILLMVIFYLAVLFENASGARLQILLGLFMLYILVGVARSIYRDRDFFYNYSYIIDIVLIYFIEHNSRFLINYFVHSFYIVILLEASLLLNRKRSLVIGIITVATSLIKYILMIYYKNNFANLSEMIFFILINSLILIIANFAQYYREEKEKKDLLYKELLSTHKKLKAYADKVQELTKLEERNRIAKDIHDTLGHSMTALIMQIEMSEHIMDEDIDSSKKLLKEAKETAREGLVKIREAVEALREDNPKTRGIDSIKELIRDFTNKTKVDITLEVKGEIIGTDPLAYSALYRIIQESLTNSVRHGNATKIDVYLSYTSSGVDFVIKNNGQGVESINEGFGITGMRERVETLRGKIEFEGINGFTVKGHIPMEVK